MKDMKDTIFFSKIFNILIKLIFFRLGYFFVENFFIFAKLNSFYSKLICVLICFLGIIFLQVLFFPKDFNFLKKETFKLNVLIGINFFSFIFITEIIDVVALFLNIGPVAQCLESDKLSSVSVKDSSYNYWSWIFGAVLPILSIFLVFGFHGLFRHHSNRIIDLYLNGNSSGARFGGTVNVNTHIFFNHNYQESVLIFRDGFEEPTLIDQLQLNEINEDDYAIIPDYINIENLLNCLSSLYL